MRFACLLLAVCSLATFPLSGQPSRATPAGAKHYEISSIDLEPVSGRPLSIEFSIEAMQRGVVFDRGEGLLARDSEGRVFQHVKWFRPEDWKLFQIIDGSSQMYCWMAIKRCVRTGYWPAQWPTLCGTRFGSPGIKLRKVGQYVIDGIAVTRTRETVVSNDYLVVSSDRWLNPQLYLELVVYLQGIGEPPVKYRVEKLSLSEPDPDLFRIPEDFSY
jgi:hypothetical protein